MADEKTNQNNHSDSELDYKPSDVNKNELRRFIANKEKENLTSSQLFEKYYADIIDNNEYSCGFGYLRGPLLQKLANKKVYVFLYGITGCIFSATYAYFNGTITTIEKRFKIPTQTTGIISVGNDISQLFLSAILSYYAGRRHKPRWMAFGLVCISIFCFLNMLPHFLYGAGNDALSLTEEFGNGLSSFSDDSPSVILNEFKNKTLCHRNSNSMQTCEWYEGSFAPQIILFLAQFIAGIGGSLYFTLGVAYMDDNIKKSKTPALVSFSYFLRMLGPAIGYTLASFCLKIYISPTLTPKIEITDPRWLGAWWMGWAILGIGLLFSAALMAMFPKELPRAAARKRAHKERLHRGLSVEQPAEEIPTSLKDMILTFKRLCKNAILMCNNISGVFYFFGFLPYWIFTPKYIEIQYKQSASIASFVTGSVALAFSALGILLSGLVISRFKPSARYMAGWNVLCGAISVFGILTYSFLGCPANENTIRVPQPDDANAMCVNSCNCDYVKYSPVCASNGLTYISACHAGCMDLTITNVGGKIFDNCSCTSDNATAFLYNDFEPMTALPGPCEVNCYNEFLMFLGVVCFLKFISATGRATNFLVSVRCVDEKDKSVSMGFGLMLLSLFAFIPSPIFFGSLLDRMCLVWGKTCQGKGNCWLYDVAKLRNNMNYIAASFVFIGTLFDLGVWYFVKDLKIFDDDGKDGKSIDIKLEDFEEPVRRGSIIEQLAR